MWMLDRDLEALLLATAYIAESSLSISPFGLKFKIMQVNPVRYYRINFSKDHELLLVLHFLLGPSSFFYKNAASETKRSSRHPPHRRPVQPPHAQPPDAPRIAVQNAEFQP